MATLPQTERLNIIRGAVSRFAAKREEIIGLNAEIQELKARLEEAQQGGGDVAALQAEVARLVGELATASAHLAQNVSDFADLDVALRELQATDDTPAPAPVPAPEG
jgi:chromosome segregation ATPase